VEIARQLTPNLAPRYIARAEKRYVVESVDDLAVEIEEVIPDVGVRQAGDKTFAGTSFKSTAPTLELATVMPRKLPHVWVEIRDAKLRKLVTAIEILSPTNKVGRGRRESLNNRARSLHSSAHLLEIDLVRNGRRLPTREKLPPSTYFVFLSRAERRPITEIWPILFDQPLPTVPVPLLPGDQDVSLDLQTVLTTVYELCRYDIEIDYSIPPETPLPLEMTEWCEKTTASRKT
jgi:hypothetical protein